MVQLQVIEWALQAKDSGKVFSIKETITVGRRASCEIVIPDLCISREHARLFILDGKLVVEDLSENGTSVNGTRITGKSIKGKPTKQVVVKDGDEIDFVHYRFQVVQQPSPKPEAALPYESKVEFLGSLNERPADAAGPKVMPPPAAPAPAQAPDGKEESARGPEPERGRVQAEAVGPQVMPPLAAPAPVQAPDGKEEEPVSRPEPEKLPAEAAGPQGMPPPAAPAPAQAPDRKEEELVSRPEPEKVQAEALGPKVMPPPAAPAPVQAPDRKEELVKSPEPEVVRVRKTKWWERADSGPQSTIYIDNASEIKRLLTKGELKPPRDLTVPVLEGLSETVKGRRIALKTESIIVGRSPKSDEVIEDERVSDQHAQILVEKGTVSVISLPNCTNGTFVNEARAAPRVYLKSGDIVRFGTVDFVFWSPQDRQVISKPKGPMRRWFGLGGPDS